MGIIAKHPWNARTTSRRKQPPIQWGLFVVGVCVWSCATTNAAAQATRTTASPPHAKLSVPVILTQIPAPANRPAGFSRGVALDFGRGGRLLLIQGATTRVLSSDFASACDPCVSFDGRSVLFSGKRKADDPWNIFEMRIGGSELRQVTRDLGNCRQPGYQSTLYTIVSTEPWYQLTFVSDAAGGMNEDGSRAAWHLYSCKLDGGGVRQITYNVSDDGDPFLMGDGRIVYASWQRGTLRRGPLGRMTLFGVNIDGTDDALFADPAGKRFKRMPCVTSSGTVVFIESDRPAADGSGQVGAVSFRRPLKSYRSITQPAAGHFHSPAPWIDGRVLISRRANKAGTSYGLNLLDARDGTCQVLFDDPRYDELQARVVRPMHVPDGRSSVVNEKDPNGKLYCLNVMISDLPGSKYLRPGQVRRLRVLEGVPVSVKQKNMFSAPPESMAGWRPGSSRNGLPPLVQRRILGEVDVHEDGSFNLEVPANIPIQLQTLDEHGMALRSCGWIWARNRERRGCIGCHEDGELVPDNVFVESVRYPSIRLTLPPKRRRTVDFRRDVMPILANKCTVCHAAGGVEPRLDVARRSSSDSGPAPWFNRAYRSLLAPARPNDLDCVAGRYVTPGQARTSPLVWHMFGRNTSRPWDKKFLDRPVKRIPPDEGPPLTDDERRTIVEWIDMGALWNGIPAVERNNK